MLRYDQAVFLDDVTPADVEAALNVRLVAVPNEDVYKRQGELRAGQMTERPRFFSAGLTQTGGVTQNG